MDPPSQNNEPENLRSYHLDLYDSYEDLEIFSEEPFQRRDLALQEKRKTLTKELVDLGKLSHLDKDEEKVEQVTEVDPSSEGTASEAGSGGAKSHHQGLPGVDKDMDTYCITCCVPIRARDQSCGEHEEHEVIPLTSVVEIAKVRVMCVISLVQNSKSHFKL